jgi:hypothetical protein
MTGWKDLSKQYGTTWKPTTHKCGDLIGLDLENKPKWDSPSGLPDMLQELMLRKTPPKDALHLRLGQYWCVKAFGTE